MKASIVVAAIKCPRCSKIFEYKILSNIHLTNMADPKSLQLPEEPAIK